MFNQKHFISLVLIALVFSFKFSYSQQEKPAYDFLRVDPSARSSALSGAFETTIEDPNVIFYNPAGLSTINKKMVSAGFGKYLLDINFGSLSYAMKYKDIGWFGVGIKYFSYGEFDYADEEGNTFGTFGAHDLMLSVGYSNIMYEKIKYGINIKFIQSKIADYGSTAIAADFGFMYQLPVQELTVGLSINNLGQQMNSYIDTKEKLPLDVRIGISKKLEHLPLKVNVSFAKLNESTEKLIQHLKAFAIGGEFTFSQNFIVRIGYSNEKRQDLKLGTSLGIAGFSGGIGLKFADKYSIDYSLNSMGKIGSTHRFNVGYTFDK